MGNMYIDVVQVGVCCLLLIGVGFVLSKFKIMSPDEFKVFNKMNTYVNFPFLLFRSLAYRKLRDITFQPLINALLMSASTQVFVAIIVFALPLQDRLQTYLSTIISSAYINYIIIGLPIFNSIWGTSYNHIPGICPLAHYILLVPLFMIWSQLWQIKKKKKELSEQRQREALAQQESNSTTGEGLAENLIEGENAIDDKKDNIKSNLEINEENLKLTWKDVVMAFVNAAKTPIVIGNVVGLIWSATGLSYPLFFEKIGKFMGDIVLVLALVSIGRFLQVNSILSCKWYQLLACLVIRFFVCPGFSLLYALAFKLDGRLSRQCVILSSLPAANAGFILANSVGLGANVASAMVFWSLILIVPVLMFWFFIFDKTGIFPED